MFTRAIVRRPCPEMISGLTSANLGVPNYSLAIEQHNNYIKALEHCGLEVVIFEKDSNYPDSTFVEDTALLTPNCAIIANPGALSRRGEVDEIEKVAKEFYRDVMKIEFPGTLEAGDVMMVGSHYYIGISERTNKEGATQLIRIFQDYNMSGSMVNLEKVLHLKTGVSYLENKNLVVAGEFVNKMEFSQFNIIEVDQNESYAANCIWVNNKVIVPKGFPITKGKIETAGYQTIEVDVSEFRKLDGGLSCLSLRF